MSSRRKAAAAPRDKAAKGAPGAPKESKAPRGPIVTPQALGIVFALAALVMVGVMLSKNKKSTEELSNITNQISAQNTLIATYQKKGNKKEEANSLNNALKQKLSTLDYLFLDNQDSLVPFFETTFFPLLDGSALRPTQDSKITVTAYTFQINMAMRPFDTLPNSTFFDDAADSFKIQYVPEQNGQPIEAPIDSRPSAFLEPYDITIEGFQGTYNDVKRFIKSAQQARTKDTLITVHCVKNDEGKNGGVFRTTSQWKIAMTVYFMNSEQPATGDAPPAPPGSRSC
jgi:hypothetical protein